MNTALFPADFYQSNVACKCLNGLWLCAKRQNALPTLTNLYGHQMDFTDFIQSHSLLMFTLTFIDICGECVSILKIYGHYNWTIKHTFTKRMYMIYIWHTITCTTNMIKCYHTLWPTTTKWDETKQNRTKHHAFCDEQFLSLMISFFIDKLCLVWTHLYQLNVGRHCFFYSCVATSKWNKLHFALHASEVSYINEKHLVLTFENDKHNYILKGPASKRTKALKIYQDGKKVLN